MITIRRAVALSIAFALFCLNSPAAFADDRDRQVNAMTYNMYLGTDFGEIFAAQSFPELVMEVAEAYGDVQAGNPAERIDAIADQIEAGAPTLVGLQEVALWRTGTFNDPAPATNIAYDFLEILLAELESRGLHYASVAVQTNLDAELPAAGAAIVADVRFTDRVVILARTDLSVSQFKMEATQSQTFTTLLTVPAIFGNVTIPRGWTSVDVKMRGKSYRFVNTHLESFHPLVGFAQGAELLQGPTATTLPIILAGDFNSDAEAGEATYQLMTGAGFADVWEQNHPNDPGYTWGLFLTGPSVFTAPTQRLDLILTRGAIHGTSSELVGEDPLSDITPSGLRPSDHAGVTATLVLEP